VVAKSEIAALLEIHLELVAPDIVWKPELMEGGDAKNMGVRDMIKRWLMAFCEVRPDRCCQAVPSLAWDWVQGGREGAWMGGRAGMGGRRCCRPALAGPFTQPDPRDPCTPRPLQIGTLMKRLDIGEGNYTKELEEDYDVYAAISQASARPLPPVLLCACVCVCARMRAFVCVCVCVCGGGRLGQSRGHQHQGTRCGAGAAPVRPRLPLSPLASLASRPPLHTPPPGLASCPPRRSCT
jgi:hypothetical protein